MSIRSVNLKYELVVEIQDTAEAKCAHALFMFDSPKKERSPFVDSLPPSGTNQKRTKPIPRCVNINLLLSKVNPLQVSWLIEPALIFGFCSVKWMRVFDSPWMGH